MPEQTKPFVVTDRRKFTLDGELRPDADPSPEREERESAPAHTPTAAAEQPQPAAASPAPASEPELRPPPTAEENDQARRAYEMTADRLDTAIRSPHPRMDHPPAMSFEQLVEALVVTAMMQLGAATREGQQPQV